LLAKVHRAVTFQPSRQAPRRFAGHADPAHPERIPQHRVITSHPLAAAIIHHLNPVTASPLRFVESPCAKSGGGAEVAC
jgi:hypothetical protein